MCRGTCLFLLAVGAFGQTDPVAIVRRSVAVQDWNSKLAQNYTWQTKTVTNQLDNNGRVKNTESETTDTLFIGGKEHHRVIQKNGRPLPADQERDEQRKLDRAIAEWEKLSPAERARRAGESARNHEREREKLKYIPEAFDFTLLREEAINGRPVYVIQAQPKPGYQGKYQNMLSKMEGKLWIDKTDYHWVKVEAETLESISFGLFLARLAKGSHIEFESAWVNNEIWLPSRFALRASARLVVKKFNGEQVSTFSNYRKFATDSKVVSAAEIQSH